MCVRALLPYAARRQRQEAQDAAAAAQAQMVTEVSAARSQLAAVKRQARADTDKAAAAADTKMREYVDKFREQVRCDVMCGDVLYCTEVCQGCSRYRWFVGVQHSKQAAS